MRSVYQSRVSLALVVGLVSAGACARPASTTTTAATPVTQQSDPRVGLRAGRYDAAEATFGMRLLSKTPSPEPFANSTNSDLAFTGKYAIQGNYNGFQVWDISTPSKPVLVKGYLCPASQSDVSVYKNLLFVSGEGMGGRVDCGTQGASGPVSKDRLRGIRIFDITDIANPKYIANVQTCRGSHTHTVVEDPKDKENVYIYVSGSAPVRSAEELPGCVNETPDKNPQSSLFRIEVIRVPLANPTAAAIVASPRIFQGLTAPPRHGEAPEDAAALRRAVEEAKARGQYTAVLFGSERPLPANFTRGLLDSLVKVRGGTGAPTAADSAKLRGELQSIVDKLTGEASGSGPRPGPTQCHDITVYPAVGLAGGACEGYGILLDISDVANPVRLDAAADSNFAYWHSATFNNDGTKVLFSDEWGGGGGPKCRASDPKEWGADAIFTIEPGRKLKFQSYYKLPAAQTVNENCVAHNGSLIPIPGRDVMVQSWYQGGVSIFDWTDPKNPKEIAYFDRGPVDSTRMGNGGTWSVYWYNGAIVSSEIGRGLDIAELVPTEHVSQNEIDAARTVHLDYLNAQGQPKFSWPPSFALARAYLDQLERGKCLGANHIASARTTLSSAERASGAQRRDSLTQLATQLESESRNSCDGPKVNKLSQAVKELATTLP
ncbi:MAG TPA: hypothetical protein VEA99_07680 [Gemmatimonadaceae bacterium]|nr:hypothetical protein [Gemmatimonadaceae bacterium]